LPELEPVVDGVGGDAEFGGGLFDADLAVADGDGSGAEDLVGVADSGDAPAASQRIRAGCGRASSSRAARSASIGSLLPVRRLPMWRLLSISAIC
jgi:hypothetical protein